MLCSSSCLGDTLRKTLKSLVTTTQMKSPGMYVSNCHIKNRPTATLKIGQLPHLLLKKWLNLKFNLYLCTKIVKNMEYKKRIADQILADKLDASGAVLIEGPKFCGKTTLAKQQAGSVLSMADPDKLSQR